ncbi:hypothetical protein CDEST_01084 [Colletotrichum destructivum]|uniref:LPXTG-motif cell wall anchor domain-containing protein n=1 Tax=Colletotrichum destructivum TaxID=34406 RepID=A0AAX4HYP3_9PEZI|nr:hypothetical protein CDEST_01084 [Colletotrichum destructivum]
MATATAATTAPAVPAPVPAPGSGFDAAGHAPTLNPTLSSSSASVSASASTTDDASPSSSFSFSSSSQSAVAFHTPSESATSSANSPSSPYHAHRLSHNSSKLPAFRFADLHKQHQHHPRLVLPSLLHHIPPPPSPVSPKSQAPTSQNRPTDTVADTDTDTDTAIGIGIGITTATDSAFPTTLPTTTSDLHDHQRPQHKFADQSDKNIYSPQDTRPTSLGLSHGRHPSHRQLSQLSSRISSPIHELPESPPKLSPRSRASTYQPIPTATSVSPRRPASYPDSPVIVQSLPPRRDVADPKSTALPARLQSRRAATSRSRESNATDPELPPPPVAETDAAHPSDTTDDALPSPADRTTKDWAQGQRELLLPKTLQNSSPTDERRRSVASRPPVSFKATAAAAAAATTPTASVRVAPIRSFRSSGSRRSLGLDSSTSTMRSFDFGDDLVDSNQRDRTLRALEGRRDDDYSQMTQPLSTDADDTTGDVFMKIARQEPTRRGSGDVAPAEQPSAITRIARSSHRRPLSAAVPLSYHHPVSPPQISRRLSDQQETSKKRVRQSEDDSATDPMARALAYRSPLTRDRPSSVHPAEDLGRAKTFQPTNHSASRSIVNTPRSFTFQDPMGENSPYARRRPSLTDSNSGYSARNSAYRQSNLQYGQTRTYNSSPLVPKSTEPPHTEAQQDPSHVVEGTESTATASTNAPSTVWDELDDLKSRIHRLELTGKFPATSGAAMSRASDERPPTATNTTMSTSPKRTSGGNSHPHHDAVSTTSSQRETQQPILLSAVSKSKPFLSDEVARALEVAATDALALANMMGTAGQPGPISSGASTIGIGTNLTDRQLRRKADSICRSLTELVLALSEEAAGNKTVQVNVPAPKETTTPSTPTVVKTFTGAVAQRRPSITSEQQTLPKPNSNAVTSPRALSKYEERRNTMLNSSALPTPRFALPPGTIPSTPGDGNKTAHRKSSLFIGRSRRAVTEEPEDGRRSSMLLRTRRAGTEEPEDSRETGRQTSLLRSRRGTVGEEDDETRFRAPSRAATELTTPARAVSHTYHSQTASNEVSSPASSALPRRRFGASSLASRLVAPSTPSMASRRYLERTPEREQFSSAEKPTEERSQQAVAQPRHFSLSHTSLLNRASSISRSRPNRDSTITNSSTAAQSGSYR